MNAHEVERRVYLGYEYVIQLAHNEDTHLKGTSCYCGYIVIPLEHPVRKTIGFTWSSFGPKDARYTMAIRLHKKKMRLAIEEKIRRFVSFEYEN